MRGKKTGKKSSRKRSRKKVNQTSVKKDGTILTVDDTRKIAELARIKLTPEEETLFTKQLNTILDYFKKISELDTENVPARTHPTDIVNNFREDEVKPSLSQEEALMNAPKRKNGFFKAPRII